MDTPVVESGLGRGLLAPSGQYLYTIQNARLGTAASASRERLPESISGGNAVGRDCFTAVLRTTAPVEAASFPIRLKRFYHLLKKVSIAFMHFV